MSSESVYALIPEVRAPPQKPARYHSKFGGSANAPPTCSTFGFQGTSVVVANVAGSTNNVSVHPTVKSYATFGRAVTEEISPKSFLKKTATQNAAAASVTADGSKRIHDVVKPAIPAKEDKPVMGLKTDKNFVVANAVENILAVPKKNTLRSPTDGRAVERDDYGKVPEYIHKVKAELKQQYELIDSVKVAKAKDAEQFSQLSHAEIQELRAGLQKRWDTLNKEFQTMGFSVETFSQKRRQEQVEAELRSVEAALQKINKPHIFVFDDQK